MHDGIHVEKAGIPAAVICTDRFEVTAKGMAETWGAPDFPVIYTNHPVGTLDRDGVKERAGQLADPVVAVLTGVEVSELTPRA